MWKMSGSGRNNPKNCEEDKMWLHGGHRSELSMAGLEIFAVSQGYSHTWHFKVDYTEGRAFLDAQK